MKKTIIKSINLWKIYKLGNVEVPALKNMNLEVNEGDFLAILGPSGSGKSTSLNSIGCLDTPTRGNLELENIDISSLNESELAQIRGKKIGFIFQQFNLINTISALENVTLPMIFQRIPEQERIRRAVELLTIFGLKDRLNHKPAELSGGEQQRVAIARALANDPDIIVADEPTGNLDSKTGLDIIKFLKELNKKGKTIILVTHDQSLTKYAKRIIYLKDGQIIKEVKNAS